MNLLARLTIILAAIGALWLISDGFLLALEILAAFDAKWFDILFAFCQAILAPGLAIAAIVLAAGNIRLLVAAIAVVLAFVSYCVPFVAFAVAVMIYGF